MKNWNKPEIFIETFTPNQRIAACTTNVNQYTDVDVTWHCGRLDGSSDDSVHSAHNAYIGELNALDIFFSNAAGCTTCVSSFDELSGLVANKFGYLYEAPRKGSQQSSTPVFCKDSNSEHCLRIDQFNIYEDIINS